MKETREWEMICELMDCRDDMTDSAREFIESLYHNLSPHEPFKDQLIGLPESMDKQEKWLLSLYEKHCNEDDEAAEDIFDDD